MHCVPTIGVCPVQNVPRYTRGFGASAMAALDGWFASDCALDCRRSRGYAKPKYGRVHAKK